MNVPKKLTIVMHKPLVQTPTDRSHVLVTLVGLAMDKFALVCENLCCKFFSYLQHMAVGDSYKFLNLN